MEPKSNVQKKKTIDIISSRLTSKNKACELLLIHIINNMNQKDKKKHLVDKGRNSFTKKNIIMYCLIILLLTQMIFLTNCQNIIISNDSIITLKVSQNGKQKIFNGGTEPDEIWIDKEQKKYLIKKNIYDLNTINIVTLKWISTNIVNCSFMFSRCESIIEMNFTYFNATNCPNTNNMFENCYSLRSLNLSGFFTSNSLISMANMFWGCQSLISLNLSNFDTSEVTSFGHLFTNCKSMDWVDISKINTKEMKCIDNMFNECKKLTYVNLSNFVAYKPIKMENMFYGCVSLKSIDISNLNLSYVENLNGLNDVFFNCTSLEYINLKISTENIDLQKNFLAGLPKNLIILISSNECPEAFPKLIEAKAKCVFNCSQDNS